MMASHPGAQHHLHEAPGKDPVAVIEAPIVLTTRAESKQQKGVTKGNAEFSRKNEK